MVVALSIAGYWQLHRALTVAQRKALAASVGILMADLLVIRMDDLVSEVTAEVVIADDHRL